MNLVKTIVCVGFAMATVCPALYAIQSLGDIVVGGTYRMELMTGDLLEGVVDSKTDSTLVLAKNDGQGVEFKGTLIINYTLLEPPRSLALTSAKETTVGTAGENLTYNELLRRGFSVGSIDVRVNNGALYRGVVGSIDEQTLRLDIDGSIIPINRTSISQIIVVVDNLQTPPDAAATTDQPSGPLDTVIVQNPEKDEWGKSKGPINIIGTITATTDQGITVKTTAGEIKELPLATVLRTIQHSEDGEETQIKRYAKSLFCPADMILIDMPPGKPNMPFFKLCIDKYEYPNAQGSLPQGNLSYSDAQRACKSKGKRLCTVEEWQWACSGLEGYAYPYGWVIDKKTCNTEGVTKLEASGKRYNCVGKFGVFDMVGNIFEWTAAGDGSPMLMGGPYSKCQTVSPGGGGDAKPQTGARCCLSN
jgi:hypothetical protein